MKDIVCKELISFKSIVEAFYLKGELQKLKMFERYHIPSSKLANKKEQL